MTYDFFKGLFTPIVDFFIGASGSVATSAAGAVATDALKAAVVGAVIGAAKAAITGEDISKAALRGAAIGGLVGGVASSFGQMMDTDASIIKGDAVSKDLGLYQTQANIERGSAGETGGVSATRGLLSTTKDKILGMDTEMAKIVGNIGAGAATAYGEMEGAKTKAESEKELLERGAAINREKIAANQPGSFAPFTARVDQLSRIEGQPVVEWWMARTGYKQPPGILSTGAVS